MDEQNVAGLPPGAPPPEPGVMSAAGAVPPDVVLAATKVLADAGAIPQPMSEVTVELLQILRLIMEQAGVEVDLGNPQALTEFLNVIASTPGAAGANPGANPGPGPSGVEPIGPDTEQPAGLNSGGAKRLAFFPGPGRGY